VPEAHEAVEKLGLDMGCFSVKIDEDVRLARGAVAA
jgi:hypothetical protein